MARTRALTATAHAAATSHTSRARKLKLTVATNTSAHALSVSALALAIGIPLALGTLAYDVVSSRKAAVEKAPGTNVSIAGRYSYTPWIIALAANQLQDPPPPGRTEEVDRLVGLLDHLLQLVHVVTPLQAPKRGKSKPRKGQAG